MPAVGVRAETIGAALDDAVRRLRRTGVPDPRPDAEWLLADLLGWDRGTLRSRVGESIPAGLRGCWEERVGRRARREPLQYILGTQEFYGRPFRVDRRVLIPRPETEGIVDAVLALGTEPGARIADLGTGSGCLAVTLALELPTAVLYALDRSAAALEVAEANAADHGVGRRIAWRVADFGLPPEEWLGTMQVVVSNPPYVSAGEWSALQPEVRDHDPREALVAGPTGLEAYASAVPTAHRLLVAGGTLVLELGAGQDCAVAALVQLHGFEEATVRPDLRGIARVLTARAGSVGSRGKVRG